MKSEQLFDGRRVAFSLSPYKQLGFYQILDPNGPHLYGYHILSTILKIFLLFVQCITIFGVLGFFIEIEDDEVNYDESNTFEIIIILTNCTLSSLKIYTLLSNAKLIWKFFDLTCVDFLKSSQHNNGIRTKFTKRCKRSTTITNWIARCFLMGMILWFMGPFIANNKQFEPLHIARGRYQNIINIKFPVTVNIYNKYYYVFYFMEISIGFCIVYGSVLVDAFLMSFCWIIAAQYQSITTSYEIFGHDQLKSAKKNNTNDIFNDFKLIIYDHQVVYLKMKSFYAVVRPITLIHVFAYSCSLIVYTYVIVKILDLNNSTNIAEIMKIYMTAANVMIEIFIFCYLFELVDSKKNAVNFGLYSCNWTGMEIKFKKLLIMTMKMNNANLLKLKATPDITMNRTFFASVIHTCFKIVSVLIQTQSSDF